MSLVNDALKRAKEAQQPTPAPPISGPPFKDLDTVEESARWVTSPVTMAVVAVIALIVVWQSLRRGNEPSRSEGNSTPVAARSFVTQEVSPAAAEPPPPKPEATVAVSPDTTVAESQSNEVTNTHTPLCATGHPAPPPPPPLKLQAVIWSPKRPSGTISGTTVFVGDQIRDFKVTKITQDSVTLSGPDEVKVLKLVQ
jgi:hypothetical protein